MLSPLSLSSIFGGALIGLSATLLFIGLGKIAGISGIFANLFSVEKNKDRAWQLLFVIGLISGSLIYDALVGISFQPRDNLPTLVLIIAGLLVGFGTQLGNGCTSGHGVCGIARKSQRSITATLVFMVIAIITVAMTHFILEI
jgi:uncharacterized membrane protein YedE/YeeE